MLRLISDTVVPTTLCSLDRRRLLKRSRMLTVTFGMLSPSIGRGNAKRQWARLLMKLMMRSDSVIEEYRFHQSLERTSIAKTTNDR